MNKEFLKQDYSEVTSLNSSEIRKLLIMTEEQKEELIAALARYLFATYSGKNLLVKYDDKEICVICRGTKFHVYSPNSKLVHPQEYTFADIINQIQTDIRSLDMIKEFKILSNREATEFIRDMYTKRAEESKKYLSNILTLED